MKIFKSISEQQIKKCVNVVKEHVPWGGFSLCRGCDTDSTNNIKNQCCCWKFHKKYYRHNANCSKHCVVSWQMHSFKMAGNSACVQRTNATVEKIKMSLVFALMKKYNFFFSLSMNCIYLLCVHMLQRLKEISSFFFISRKKIEDRMNFVGQNGNHSSNWSHHNTFIVQIERHVWSFRPLFCTWINCSRDLNW